GRKVKQIEIADLDRIGKREVLITYQKTVSGQDARFIVLVNTSSGAISFSPTVITKSLTGTLNTSADAIAARDLNGDNLPEIVVSRFLTTISNIYVVENNSTPGNINLGNVNTFSLSGAVANIKIADLDGDG